MPSAAGIAAKNMHQAGVEQLVNGVLSAAGQPVLTHYIFMGPGTYFVPLIDCPYD